MSKNKISLKVNGQYTIYTYSEVTNSAHRIEFKVLNVLSELVDTKDTLEGRVAIATGVVRGQSEPISIQVKLESDLIIEGWDLLELSPANTNLGIIFHGGFVDCYKLMLDNLNTAVKDYDHCFYLGSDDSEPGLIFPIAKEDQ